MNKYFLKLNKKLGQAVSTLTKVEKESFEKLTCDDETGRFIVIHFGLGTEQDYLGLKKFLVGFGLKESSYMLDIYPGYSHAFLNVESKQIAKELNDFIYEHNINELKLLEEKKKKKALLAQSKEKMTEPGDLKHQPSLANRKFMMKNICLAFEDRERNCFFFNTLLQADQLKCFSSQSNSLQAATANYSKLLDYGLIVIPEVLSKEEETWILNEVYNNNWENLSHRRVQHYGYKFIYGTNTIDKEKNIGELPQWSTGIFSKGIFRDLYDSVVCASKEVGKSKSDSNDASKTQHFPESNIKLGGDKLAEPQNGQQPFKFNSEDCFANYFDQLTVNEYQPGSGIPPHTDSHAPFEEPLLSISLLSDTVMLFRNPQTGEEFNVLIPARSACLMTGESRYLWTHSIASRKIDRIESGLLFRRKRVSLTYRKSRAEPFCSCPYQPYCDYAQHSKGSKIKEGIDFTDPEFEKRYVKDVYNSIAEHFSHTRYKAWPSVRTFLSALPPGSIVGDIGCGNGKYIFCVSHLQFIGSDIAENFAKICKEKDPRSQVLVSDTISIPFRDSSLDHAISIAVIHHLSSEERRKQAIKELMRIVKPGGRVLIYVWAYEQDDKKFAEQDVFVPWNNQLKFESQTDPKDTDKVLNESKQTMIYKRFYHVFKKGELEDLVSSCRKEVPFGIEIKNMYYDHENWCIELEKTA